MHLHDLTSITSQVLVRNLPRRMHSCLSGHTGDVNCISLSQDGAVLISGERVKPGAFASVNIWGVDQGELVHSLKLHKTVIESVALSPMSKYAASLGGVEDGNQLVIWDVVSGNAITSIQAHSEPVSAISFYRKSDIDLITVGKNHIRHWTFYETTKKVSFEQVSTGGSLKRTFTTISIDPQDTFGYSGTSTGDFVEIDLSLNTQRRIGPLKSSSNSHTFGNGITCSQLIPGGGDLIIGYGDGHLVKVALNNFRVTNQETQLSGAISSITFTSDGTHFFACTNCSNVYWVETDSMRSEIRATSHSGGPILSLAFPHNSCDVLASAGGCEIRLWNAKTKQEILAIQVPKITCNCIAFMRDGKSIISGWEDGKIRAFTPQSGKLIYAINDAHKDGVTCITAFSDCSRILSGGMHGEIRCWKISKSYQQMEKSLKEHKSRVSQIQINESQSSVRAVSASFDGSCIVWDVTAGVRLLCVFEKTNFRSVAYCSDFSQFVTIGGNHIVYWDDAYATGGGGQPIRTIEEHETCLDLTTLCMSADDHFVVGTTSGTVRMYHYDQGECVCEGKYLGAPISACIISPRSENLIVTGHGDGSISFWATC